jgi:CobQ-like glutamine amidotransferase family enzyme
MDTPMGKVVINRHERNREEILQGFDKHLGLTILNDENGKFLKITQWN